MEQPFIGMGHNPEPDVPDIPLGLGMALAQDMGALSYFGGLSPQQKTAVIHYVQGGSTGDDAKERIRSAVEMMRQQDLSIFNQIS